MATPNEKCIDVIIYNAHNKEIVSQGVCGLSEISVVETIFGDSKGGHGLEYERNRPRFLFNGHKLNTSSNKVAPDHGSKDWVRQRCHYEHEAQSIFRIPMLLQFVALVGDDTGLV